MSMYEPYVCRITADVQMASGYNLSIQSANSILRSVERCRVDHRNHDVGNHQDNSCSHIMNLTCSPISQCIYGLNLVQVYVLL